MVSPNYLYIKAASLPYYYGAKGKEGRSAHELADQLVSLYFNGDQPSKLAGSLADDCYSCE